VLRFAHLPDNAGDPTRIGMHNATKESPMFRNSSILRIATGLAVAVFLAQPLAGCSGATQALPSGTPVQSSQMASSSNAPLAAAQKRDGGVNPMNCVGCNNCPPNYSYGTWWEEFTDTNPPTWAEYTGDYTIQVVNGVAEYLTCGTWKQDQVCNPASYVNCPPQNYWWNNMAVDSYIDGTAEFAVADATNNSVVVVGTKSKNKAWNLISTLTTEGSTPVGVAADHSGTIYASVLSAGSSIQPSVYVYTNGATSPSSVLNDADASGDSPAGIAVDKRRDVFWAFDSVDGSAQTIQIVEFPQGENKPIPFASIPGSGGGALAVTTKGEIVASSPSEGMVYVFDPTGKALGSFSASGSPSSISLDRKDQNLYVADGANNKLSIYSFPSGTLISSASLTTKKKKVIFTPASFLPKDPQLP
jgi:hypothetical protein